MRHLFLALFALPLLAACASLSEDECRAGDWHEIGVNDGTKGRTADYVRTHAKACADYGVRPDVKTWERGRQVGLTAYCTPQNAYREGSRGRRLSPVCPASDLANLLAANDRGLDLYDLESEIDAMDRQINDIRDTLAGLDVDDPQRSALGAELRFLQLRLLQLEARRMRYTRVTFP